MANQRRVPLLPSTATHIYPWIPGPQNAACIVVAFGSVPAILAPRSIDSRSIQAPGHTPGRRCAGAPLTFASRPTRTRGRLQAGSRSGSRSRSKDSPSSPSLDVAPFNTQLQGRVPKGAACPRRRSSTGAESGRELSILQAVFSDRNNPPLAIPAARRPRWLEPISLLASSAGE